MKRNRLNLSIALNQAIEPIVKENFRFCKLKEKDGYALFFCDSDFDTDFYFGISKETFDSGSHNIYFSCKPGSATRPNSISTATALADFSTLFKNWFSNIKFYQQESILDDNLLTGYEKEFYDDFKIVDEDADYRPFDRNQQLLLNQFLENCINNINEVEDEKNSAVVNSLKIELKDLQSDITSETKNSFMRRFSQIYAKAKKGGLKISEFLIKELGKEILKESVRVGFGFAANHSQEIIKYLHL